MCVGVLVRVCGWGGVWACGCAGVWVSAHAPCASLSVAPRRPPLARPPAGCAAGSPCVCEGDVCERECVWVQCSVGVGVMQCGRGGGVVAWGVVEDAVWWVQVHECGEGVCGCRVGAVHAGAGVRVRVHV